MTHQQSVAVVAGVGPGLSAAVCRRLARAGYAVAGLARSGEFGDDLAVEINSGGGRMVHYACDVTDADGVADTYSRIESDLGRPSVLVYTAGQILMKPIVETSAEEFHEMWALNCQGAFLCVRQVTPEMIYQRKGTIIFSGATAGVKAGARFAAFASAKFALRGLAQALARELGPQGIHVVHVVIDGIIWTPRTRQWPGVEEGQCLHPEAIAETYLQLIEQDRSAWTQELDLRPDVEAF